MKAYVKYLAFLCSLAFVFLSLSSPLQFYSDTLSPQTFLADSTDQIIKKNTIFYVLDNPEKKAVELFIRLKSDPSLVFPLSYIDSVNSDVDMYCFELTADMAELEANGVTLEMRFSDTGKVLKISQSLDTDLKNDVKVLSVEKVIRKEEATVSLVDGVINKDAGSIAWLKKLHAARQGDLLEIDRLLIILDMLPLETKKMLLISFFENDSANLQNIFDRSLRLETNIYLDDYLNPVVYWQAQSGTAFPSVVDKSQWVVIEAETPFMISEEGRTLPGEHKLSQHAVSFGDKYICIMPPSKYGGKRKLSVTVNTQEGENYSAKVFQYKRENLETYVEYTESLLKRFKTFSENLEKIEKGPFKEFVHVFNSSMEPYWDDLIHNFHLKIDENYTLGKEDGFNVIKKSKDPANNDELFQLAFKMINLFRRGRIYVKEKQFFMLLIIQLSQQMEATKGKSIYTLLTEKMRDGLDKWMQRVKEADLKNPSNVNLVQLNARVEGQRPKDITEEMVLKWKRKGHNMVYLMGVWDTSPFSEAYNKHWGAKDNRTDGKERVASAFAIRDYMVSKALGGDVAVRKLARLLKKHGMSLMLDFVPNHMAMDNDYLPQHPEYFKHEEVFNMDGSPYWIDGANYSEFVPDNWPRHPNGKVKFKLWYSKDFDSYWGSDHFLMQELDEDGNQVKVLKFYHGNWNWRDTVQIDYQNPEARKFMRQNYMRAVRLTMGGGIRWDFVHVTLQKYFNNSWERKNFKEFLRGWKGVKDIPERSYDEWAQLFSEYLKGSDYEGNRYTEYTENVRVDLERIIGKFKLFLKEKIGVAYPSLAVAFHFEGLQQVIKEALFSDMEDDDFREVFDAVPSLRFHEVAERSIMEGKKYYPQLVNIGEAYEEESYLLSLGFDAIYGAYIHKMLVEKRHDGVSFEDSVHNFFNMLQHTNPYWDLMMHVLYMQNFDENPAVFFMSPEEVLFKAALLYGLPGQKFTEWGLTEGNTSRLGADWIHKLISPKLREMFAPFFDSLIKVSANKIIGEGAFRQIDFPDGIRGYIRKQGREEIVVLANLSNEEKSVHWGKFMEDNQAKNKILFSSKPGPVLSGRNLTIPPKSVVWVYRERKSIVELKLQRKVLHAA